MTNTLLKTSIAALAFFSQTLPALAQDRASDRVLTGAEISVDIKLAEEAFSRVHPGYTRYATTDQMTSAWADIITDGQDGMRAGEFYLRVQEALAQIRCDHTKANLSKEMNTDRKVTPTYLPFIWTVIEGRAFIQAVPENSDFLAGDEILKIDGQNLSDLLKAWAPYIPVDGYTDHVRYHELAYSSEFNGPALSHFQQLAGGLGSEANLLIKRKGSGDVMITAGRLSGDDFDALSRLINSGARNFKDAVEYKKVSDGVGYVSVGTFVNYRDPVDPNKIYGPIFEQLNADGVETLIVDLRENGGGSDDASKALIQHLITEKIRIVKDVRVSTLDLSGIRDHLSTWEKKALNPKRWWFKKNADQTFSLRQFLAGTGKIKPAKNAFNGQIILLSSRFNSSGSTMLLSRLSELENVTIVGEVTGGSAEGPTAGILFTLTLPESGLRLRLPMQRSYVDVTGFTPGKGVTPDVAAPDTVESFLSGNDPALEAALDMARK